MAFGPIVGTIPTFPLMTAWDLPTVGMSNSTRPRPPVVPMMDDDPPTHHAIGFDQRPPAPRTSTPCHLRLSKGR